MEKLEIILTLFVASLIGAILGSSLTTMGLLDITLLGPLIGVAGLFLVTCMQMCHNKKQAKKQREFNQKLVDREENRRIKITKWIIKVNAGNRVPFDYTPETEHILVELLHRGLRWDYSEEEDEWEPSPGPYRGFPDHHAQLLLYPPIRRS